MSPIVDCGVHYVDVMCQMTGARPIRVSGVGARLTNELKPDMFNYGQLQVTFDDGSVGWYEAGWGPMMSEVAFFVKDVIGPRGSVSIVKDPNEAAVLTTSTATRRTACACTTAIDAERVVKPDEFINTEDGRITRRSAIASRPIASRDREDPTSPPCRTQSTVSGSCSRLTRWGRDRW
jgi:predicted dehydrogenase